MSGETLTIGVLPLGRPTFDVVFAEEMLAGMMADLRASGHRLVGSEELLMTPDATEVAMADIKAENPDRILILQVTFTDAVMTCRIADTFTQPLAIWAVPEPRLGGRLRLNAFCGLNLASHALGLRGRLFSWRYAAPHTSGIEALLAEEPMVCPLIPQKAEADSEYGGALLDGNSAARASPGSARIRTGSTPAPMTATGLQDAHRNDRDRVRTSGPVRPGARGAGIGGKRAQDDAFGKSGRTRSGRPDGARPVAQAEAGARRHEGGGRFRCLRHPLLARNLHRIWRRGLRSGLDDGRGPGAVRLRGRCLWRGDAAPVAGGKRPAGVPGRPGRSGSEDDTGVVWHCGQAPISMADPDAVARATIHTNRKMPLCSSFRSSRAL
jgi:hypothetical protein